MRWVLLLSLAFLWGSAGAQEQQVQQLPERDALFWCKQQRNFMADTSAENAAAASKLQEENSRLRAEIEKLKAEKEGK